ncbi:MAG TPA: adenylyltransferase/cytidyltransferase family protein, partial [Treponemataceae bacterium]|nr:adenylyltransferase/cytidyltransferase family protein [Treponemataceae bacterium]
MKSVYLGMTGDIIHPGIINILNEASKIGEVTVGLLTDSAIAAHKRLPYLSYDQRKQVVENLKGVARVVPQEDWSYVPNLKKYRPDVIIHGDDWRAGPLSKIREEVIATMREIGGEVVEVPYTKGINSTALNDTLKTLGTTPEVRMKTLRRLLAAKPVVRIMEAHSGLSGLIIENIEVIKDDGTHAYDGMWSSSLTDST